MNKRDQLSVPMPPELRELTEEMARREDRTMASLVRHLILEAARNTEPQRQRRAG